MDSEILSIVWFVIGGQPLIASLCLCFTNLPWGTIRGTPAKHVLGYLITAWMVALFAVMTVFFSTFGLEGIRCSDGYLAVVAV